MAVSGTPPTPASGLVWKRGTDHRDENNMYRVRGGSYPSVTSILDPLGDYLWAHIDAVKKEVYRLGELHENGEVAEAWVETVLESGSSWGKQSVYPLELILNGDYISKSGLRMMKVAADRGSVCHEIFAEWCQGIQYEESELGEACEGHIYEKSLACSVDDVLPFAKNLVLFLSDWKFSPYLSECCVLNESDGYAGTMDIAGYDGFTFMKGDLKTSGSPNFERRWVAQLSAYDHASAGIIDDGMNISVDLHRADTLFVLNVTPEKAGIRYISPSESEEYYQKLLIPALQCKKAMSGLPMPKEKYVWKK